VLLKQKLDGARRLEYREAERGWELKGKS